MKQILFLVMLCITFSCSHSKETKNSPSQIDNSLEVGCPENSDVEFYLDLLGFVQAIELWKLCDPVKLNIAFTVDTTGKLSDPQFEPEYFLDDDCVIDSVYLVKLKADFESVLPYWKPFVINDTIKEIRISIPISFN